jgi:hypothetical protein
MRVFGWLAIIWSLCSGVATVRNQNLPPLSDGAWVETKPMLEFPYGGNAIPQSLDQFNTDLTSGLRRLAVLPDHAQPVASEPGGPWPAIGSLRIDLSHATEDADHRPPKLDRQTPPVGSLAAAKMEVAAQPLVIRQSEIRYTLTAANARLELRRDRQGMPILLLVDTDSAKLDLRVADADVQRLVLDSAKGIAKKFGFSVDSAHATLKTPDPRTIGVDLSLHFVGKLGPHFGGNLRFRARFDVHDDLTATASQLSVEGSGPVGTLVATLLGPVLAHYDYTRKTLFEFPSDQLVGRNVEVHGGDGVSLVVEFGRK